MYVHLYTPPTSLTNKHNDHKKESDHILIYSPYLLLTYNFIVTKIVKINLILLFFVLCT
jgi:hypothetical protein